MKFSINPSIVSRIGVGKKGWHLRPSLLTSQPRHLRLRPQYTSVSSSVQHQHSQDHREDKRCWHTLSANRKVVIKWRRLRSQSKAFSPAYHFHIDQ